MLYRADLIYKKFITAGICPWFKVSWEPIWGDTEFLKSLDLKEIDSKEAFARIPAGTRIQCEETESE